MKINVPKIKIRTSHLVVTKIQESTKGRKGSHRFRLYTDPKELDTLDDKFYE